jgi:hypothetical protein
VLTTIDFASEGIPHCPGTTNVLSLFAVSAGPPKGPTGFRVSTTRHGVTVKNPSFVFGVTAAAVAARATARIGQAAKRRRP